jgi:hypothetical protein
MGVSAIVLGLMSITGPPPSPASASLYQLAYRAPEGCPTEDEMRAAVTAHVRAGTRPSDVRIEIELATVDGRFAGEMRATDRFGSEDRRALAGADCGEVARALAFLAGLAVELGERRPEALISTAPPAPPRPAPPQPHSFRIAGRVMAGATGGLADGPSLVGEVGVAFEDVRPGLFAPGLVGAILLAGDNQIDGQRGSAELSLFGARLAACPVRLSKAKVELRPCVGVTFGRVWGRATSLTSSPTVIEPWLSAEAILDFRWFLSEQIFAEAEGGAVLPLERTSYAFAFQPSDQPLYTVPWVTGRVAAGFGYRF